jgi:hypothetical protein
VRVQPALGQAARRKEADLVYALFAENAGAGPTMQDAVALFHASHGNLAASGALNAATLGTGRTLLRKQTALGGGYLALTPRFLICPAEFETEAEILLAAATKHVAGSVPAAASGGSTSAIEATAPTWLTGLTLVVEPRLADDAVYLAADSAQIDTIELGRLAENENGPFIEEEREFNRDVRRWKVRHVFGAKALDWRGLVRVPIA